MPDRLLDPRVIEGFDRRARLGVAPKSNFEEVIALRAMVRELCAHIRAREAEILQEAPAR